MTASDIVPYIDAASSFDLNSSMNNVGGNAIYTTVSSFRNMSWLERQVKVYNRDGVSQNENYGMNVAEINEEKVGTPI